MKCTPFISVVRLESAAEDNQGECVSCHRKGVMEFHAFHPDGSYGFLCADCGLEELNKLARALNKVSMGLWATVASFYVMDSAR